MILTTEKTEVNLLGFEEGTSFKIKPEFLGKIFNIISGFYSDVYGSPLRELLNNAWDAEIDAGVENPSPKIKYEDGVITISDKGTGMSKDFILNRYISAGDSTKNGSNNFIGGFGVGKLAILSYLKQINETQYNLETIVDGIKYYYVIYKKDEIPNVNLLFEEETTEPNGTSVSFPVPNNYHLGKFKEAIVNQLRFFEGIQLEGFGVELKPFLKREHYCVDFNNFDYYSPHCVVGKNIYKIDVSKFGLMGEGKILLYFNVGDVDLVENREELKYTQKTLDALVNKFNLVKRELETIYNEQNLEIESIFEWIEKRKNTTAYVNIDGHTLAVTKQFKIINRASLKGFNNSLFVGYTRLQDFLELFYEVKQLRGSFLHGHNTLVYTNEEKKFSTYKLKHNNKTHIVLLNSIFEKKIEDNNKSGFYFLNNNKEEFLKFQEQLKEEILKNCLNVSELRSPVYYSKSPALKVTKEEIKYTYFDRYNRKCKRNISLSLFSKHYHNYLVFTDEKHFLQNNNICKYSAVKDCKMRTRIYLLANEYKKLLKNNIKHILHSDFIKTEEYKNAVVRGKIQQYSNMYVTYLSKQEKRLCLELKELFAVQDEINYLKKKINEGLIIVSNYNYENLKHPYLELLNKDEELKDKFHNQIEWLRRSKKLYLKYCLLNKKLEKCQSKLLKLETI